MYMEDYWRKQQQLQQLQQQQQQQQLQQQLLQQQLLQQQRLHQHLLQQQQQNRRHSVIEHSNHHGLPEGLVSSSPTIDSRMADDLTLQNCGVWHFVAPEAD
ncbi:hypothetical protein EPH_0031270 [Eimeria praecox]|uniref:Uncharacterized protein n=1 Tax=Eimeria praecox TaxID=51316 RepID=U6G1J2_9EIME|nr:hypothetical protein EPH_0031270 [Eimeria praecox]